jgi:diaminohydroxyphosphoribosylaminopyrimidine deaminase/5-amino-6-(5-phosphoribosylamino)uracil reductase
VLLDPSGRVHKSLKIFSIEAPTLVYMSGNQSPDKDGIDVVIIPQNDFLQNVLIDLHKRKVLSLLIEGGAKTLQSFIDQELWDEVLVFKSSEPLTQGLKAPEFPDGIKSTEQVGGDQLIRIAKS